MWSFVFRDVITRLRTDFRCVALDFPGFGLAPPADDDPSIADLADVLTAFVTGLDLRAATVIAHDLGGPVALATAAALPERVHGLVLANTFAWTPDHRGLRAMLRMVGGRAAETVGVTTNVVALLTSTRFGVGRHLDRAGRAAFRGPFRDRDVRRRFHRLMASTLDSPAFTDSVDHAVTTVLADRPVLTVFGERNDPLGFQARIAARFADHEGVVVGRGNHFPMMDDPDLFASSVRDWHRRWVTTRPVS
jgi:haloalkane dehalogenase